MALAAWARELRGIARVVTGGGKTVFAYLCLSKFFAEYPSGQAIVVVPTIALLDQWFLDTCDATDLAESDIACFWGGNRPAHPRKINILVLNTARQIARTLADSGPTILVIDECHRVGARVNSGALAGQHEATLGLSATPERESDDGFESRIVPALGPIVYRYDYPIAREDGVIVDFDLVNVAIDVDYSDVARIELAAISRPGTTSASRNSRPVDLAGAGLSQNEAYARSVARAIRVPWAAKLALVHRAERVIIFHERVSALERIREILARFSQNAVVYHSQLSESHRRDNLRIFRRGIVNILVTCRALDEGANVPEANVAIVALSTSSTRQRIQRLGRVLRPAPGKNRATVYTLYAGRRERARLADEAAGLRGVASVEWRSGVFK